MESPAAPQEEFKSSHQAATSSGELSSKRDGTGFAPTSIPTREVTGAYSESSQAASGAVAVQRVGPLRQRLLDAACGKTGENWAWNRTFRGLLETDSFSLDDFPSLGTKGKGLPASIKRVLLRHNPAYIPLKHLDEVVSEVLRVVQVLHGPANKLGCTGNGLLVLGPKGTGKSTVLQALAKPGVLHQMLSKYTEQGEVFRGPDKTVQHTLVLTLDLRIRLPTFGQKQSFTAWVLSSLCVGGSSSPGPAFVRSPEHAKLVGRISVMPDDKTIDTDALNSILRSCHIRVLVVVEEAENLFSSAHFSEESAILWKQQMVLVSQLAAPAIGFVLSTSMQRARQLFLSTGSIKHTFPNYAHAALLAGNWNGRKFYPVFVLPPAWTASSLAWFILQSAINMSQNADVLVTAKLLDTLFLAAPGIPFDADDGIIPHMRAFLRLHGDTPSAISCGILLEDAWVARAPSSGLKDGSQTDDMQTVLSQMLKLLTQAGKCIDFSTGKPSAAPTNNDFQPQLLLGFDANTLRLSRSELVNAVAESLKRNHQTEAPTDMTKSASCLVDSALDNDVLQELCVLEDMHSAPKVCIQLRSPQQLWEVYAKFVHPHVLDWFSRPGYGEQLELPVARALARFFSAPLGAGQVNEADSAAQNLSSIFSNAAGSASAWDATGRASSNVLLQPSSSNLAVAISNEDSQAGSLAFLPLILLDSKENLISEQSVTIAAVTAAFSEPSEGGCKAWKHALPTPANCSPHALRQQLQPTFPSISGPLAFGST